MKTFFHKYFELTAWLTALIYLALIDPAAKHFSWCVFNLLGITWCPGCGIGHSVSFLMHGDFQKSFDSHYLGFFALAVIVHRIYVLSKNNFITIGKSNITTQ